MFSCGGTICDTTKAEKFVTPATRTSLFVGLKLNGCEIPIGSTPLIHTQVTAVAGIISARAQADVRDIIYDVGSIQRLQGQLIGARHISDDRRECRKILLKLTVLTLAFKASLTESKLSEMRVWLESAGLLETKVSSCPKQCCLV